MGKYMRKPKNAAVDVSPPSSCGVRTRARTLSVQPFQSSPSLQAQKLDFLELRSRCLQKQPLFKQYLKTSRRKQGFFRGEIGSPHTVKAEESPCAERKSGDIEFWNSEIEGCFGGNNLEVNDRDTRESTPCSLIKTTDDVTTPGSSTKPASPACNNPKLQNSFPTCYEMEEFLVSFEQQEQQRFIEKYNFDIVNDLPLPGKYKWVKIMP